MGTTSQDADDSTRMFTGYGYDGLRFVTTGAGFGFGANKPAVSLNKPEKLRTTSKWTTLRLTDQVIITNKSAIKETAYRWNMFACPLVSFVGVCGGLASIFGGTNLVGVASSASSS